MQTPDGKGSTHLVHGDLRGEFVAVVEAILPETARRLEIAATLSMVAAFWGIILYFALTAFSLQ
jgi:hypothetical protein